MATDIGSSGGGGGSRTFERAPDDAIWVDLEVQRGETTTTYRGRMALGEVNAWRAGKLERATMTLFDTYWWLEEAEGKLKYILAGISPGPYRACTGTTYVRMDTVLSIMELDGSHERDVHVPKGGDVVDFVRPIKH